jgi:acyl carrier protein
MEREAIIAKLKIIVKPYTNNDESYGSMNEATDFIKDLEVNSANLVDIVLDVEETFGITIDNLEMERMLDVKTAIDIIETKLAEK